MCKCGCNKPRDETLDSTMEFTGLVMPESLYIAICIMNGQYGNGEERQNLLNSQFSTGFVHEVNTIVNNIAKYWD